MKTRLASSSDMEAIYFMGADIWGQGITVSQYLTLCRRSKKYQSGRWFCLDRGDMLVSSLVIYENRFALEKSYAGIGSVATLPCERNKGYASALISDCIETLGEQNYSGVFLFNDANSKIYGRCGFELVSETDGLMFLSFTDSSFHSKPTYF